MVMTMEQRLAFEKRVEEKERCFLVLDFGQLPSREGCSHKSMWQGYLRTDQIGAFAPVRLRVVEGEDTATLTRKTGTGEYRQEQTQRIGVREAEQLRGFVANGLHKVRYWYHKDDEYEISLDIYQRNFDGLAVIELEWRGAAQPALPTWLEDGLARGAFVEVTNSWSNVDLAYLEPWAGRERNRDRLLELLQLPAVPVIGCEGGPASGKDGFLNHMTRDFRDVVEVVPEQATHVINAGFVPSPDDVVLWMRFEQTIIESQVVVEQWRQWVARLRGCKVILTNRTLLGLAGYLPEGLVDLHRVTGWEAKQVAERYKRILLFGMPDESIYAQHHAENPSRYEQDYPAAQGVDRRIRKVLAAHPDVVEIPPFPEGEWLGKVECALKGIREIVPGV